MSRHLVAEFAIGHRHTAREALVAGVGRTTVASASATPGHGSDRIATSPHFSQGSLPAWR